MLWDRHTDAMSLAGIERSFIQGLSSAPYLRDNAQREGRDCGVTHVLRRSFNAALADLSRT
jgi:hypothetical protein